MRNFWNDESGAVTVDQVGLMSATVGLGLAVIGIASGGLEDLSNDITDMLSGIEISDTFRTVVEDVCISEGVGTGPAGGGETGETYQGNPVTGLLIYQASDFVGGLPAEINWEAGGSSPHEITVSPNARPVLMRLTDDDGFLHENDDSQRLAADITLDGQTYEAGYEISAAYTISDSASGLMASGLHFGPEWDGQMQGPVFATAASRPLEPGKSYAFDQNTTSHQNEKPYGDFLGCG